jgi:ATP-binding cassette subfamily B protein
MANKTYPTYTLIKRTVIQARYYWPYLIVLFILNLLSSPIALLKPLALKILIDNAFDSHPLPKVIKDFFPTNFEFTFQIVLLISVAVAIIVALIDNLNGVANWVLSVYTGEKLVLDFRTKLFNHIQRLSITYHDKYGTSDSLYRLQWDTTAVRTFLMGNLSPLISAFITLLSMVVVMLLIKWQFALIALCVIPALFILTRMSSKRLRTKWEKVKEEESLAMSVVHEVLNALRVVKAFGQEDHESKRFTHKSDIAVRGQVKVAWIASSFHFLVGMVFAIGTALFLYLGAIDVKAGQMTLGELTVVLAYLGQVFGPLQVISKNINDIQSSITSLDRVYSLLDTDKEVKESAHPVSFPRAKGALEFKNVSFAYEIDKPTITDISFSIKPGDRVGIMGSTGAGKSTLISLLIRFYDPSSGKILIDGTNIKDISLADYRKQFGIVLQEPVLFSATIAENIRYGRPGATEKEIIEAAKAANAHDFIINSLSGYNTIVGERGMQLSGGERQRISLARAFIKNAPVLILDEPTSSIDVKTEAQIMEAMERLMKGRTTFMITHRLDTLSTCNVILHIEKGHLVDVLQNHDTSVLELKKKTFLNSVSS